ncbi:nucleoside triphosphate pyrophosphohydrolase [Candidatus Kaiserbacteria bacterium]|nr:nucleoside triphosphate pyrophosphohydrolase [Candidatus Kaiserbacteria bacterium]MCB9812149.1 nucleoside triphosphate pyrophosphohydrolase [Candidatus Nomurabacteria bacterium]
MTHYEKLVRDRIPEILESKGVAYEQRIATDEEYRTELIKKLQEEATEFAESDGDIEELADVLEVIAALRSLAEYNTVTSIQEKKRTERGGFLKRYILKGEKP